MSLPKTCLDFLAKYNLLHHQEFFFNLGVASLDDFFDVESTDMKDHLKPLEERRFFRAIGALKSGNSDFSQKEKQPVSPEKREPFQTDIDVINNQEKTCEQMLPDLEIDEDEGNIHGIHADGGFKEQASGYQTSEKTSTSSRPVSFFIFGSKSNKTYQNATEKGMKLWTDFQIKSAVGLEKKRREYFNMKIEELCSVPVIKKSWTKTEISGAADTAWTLKKTALLQVEVNYINTLFEGKKAPKQKESTIRKNQEEMILNHKKLVGLDIDLKNISDKSSVAIKEKEEEMKFIMRKLKNSQEALRKSLQERLSQFGEEKTKINKDFEEMPLSLELQDFLSDQQEKKPDSEESDSDLEQPFKKVKK